MTETKMIESIKSDKTPDALERLIFALNLAKLTPNPVAGVILCLDFVVLLYNEFNKAYPNNPDMKEVKDFIKMKLKKALMELN